MVESKVFHSFLHGKYRFHLTSYKDCINNASLVLKTYPMAVNNGSFFSYEDVSHQWKRGVQCWQYTLIVEHTKRDVIHLHITNSDD